MEVRVASSSSLRWNTFTNESLVALPLKLLSLESFDLCAGCWGFLFVCAFVVFCCFFFCYFITYAPNPQHCIPSWCMIALIVHLHCPKGIQLFWQFTNRNTAFDVAGVFDPTVDLKIKTKVLDDTDNWLGVVEWTKCWSDMQRAASITPKLDNYTPHHLTLNKSLLIQTLTASFPLREGSRKLCGERPPLTTFLKCVQCMFKSDSSWRLVNKSCELSSCCHLPFIICINTEYQF